LLWSFASFLDKQRINRSPQQDMHEPDLTIRYA